MLRDSAVSATDERYMRIALREAAKGAGMTSPNPMVGAVAVKGDRILAKARHRKYGENHAEIELLRKLKSEQAHSATIYVNLEPCCHYGLTAPCTDALIASRVANVVVSHEDPNPLVCGRGIAQLRAAGINVTVGVLEREARELNVAFLTYITQGRPWILLKVAQSLDGRIALANGQSRWITGESSRTEVHRLRARLDAVMVGSQTVLEDDPELTVRHTAGRNPLRIVVDSRLRVPPTARVLCRTDGAAVWIMTTPDAPPENRKALEDTGALIITCPAGADGRIDLRAAMMELGRRKLTSMLVEGGGTLHASFVRAGLYDRFIVAVAPMLIGSDGKPAIHELGLTSLENVPRFMILRSRRMQHEIWLELEKDVHGNR